jgi:FK506-binding protein 1
LAGSRFFLIFLLQTTAKQRALASLEKGKFRSVMSLREALRQARQGKNYKSPEERAIVGKKILKAGDQKNFPKDGDCVSVHYRGMLKRGGMEFDSSIKRGEPFPFTVGKNQVIKGWDKAIVTMSLGEKAVFEIPSILGYGTFLPMTSLFLSILLLRAISVP